MQVDWRLQPKLSSYRRILYTGRAAVHYLQTFFTDRVVLRRSKTFSGIIAIPSEMEGFIPS